MIVKVCEKHEVELWAGEECEICALRTRVEALQKALQEVRTWGIGRFEQIEQSLRSLPDVPPLADIVRTWRDTMELAALAPDAPKEQP